MRLGKLNEGATGDFGQQFSQDWRVTGANYKCFPDWRHQGRAAGRQYQGPVAEKHEEAREYQQTNK